MREATKSDVCIRSVRDLLESALSESGGDSQIDKATTRRVFWGTTGLSLLLNRYGHLSSSSIIDEVVSLRPSDIISRLHFWFGPDPMSSASDTTTAGDLLTDSSTCDKNVSVDGLIRAMLLPVVLPFYNSELQAGATMDIAAIGM